MSQVTNFLIVSAEDLRNSGNALPESVNITVIADGKYFDGNDMVPLSDNWKVAPIEGLERAILNLTPHTVGVLSEDGTVHRIRPSGFTARAVEVDASAPSAFGCKVVKKQYGSTEGLPPEGVPVLISTIAAAGCSGRVNTFIPDSGTTCIRNERGQMDHATQLIAA